MNKSTKETIIREKNNRFKRNKNRLLITFFIVFVAGYTFFLTSNIWMPVTFNNVRSTPMGEVIEANNRKVTLIDWSYSKEQFLQEVILEISNASADGIHNYNWSAVEYNQGFYEVEEVVSEKDFVVLHIKKVTGRWSEISLRMDAGDVLPPNEEFTTIKFYTAKNTIKFVDSIEKQSEKQYRIKACDMKIETYLNQIDKLLDEMKVSDIEIANARTQIEELRLKEDFQTANEKKETNIMITELESIISIATMDNENRKKVINEYEDKIAMQELLKESY